MKRIARLGALLALALPALLPGNRLAAQTDPRLAAAVRLAQDGLSDSARAVAGRLLAATQPSDSLYPEILYTIGLLAGNERDRRLVLRRVVVDYAQSAWADDALLQLAQLDYVGGNPATTVRQIDQLLRDYPSSPLVAQASFWGARAAGDRHDGSTACRMADLGLAAVGNDIELRNQLEFQKTRCQGLVTIAADSLQKAAADSAARAKAAADARARAPVGKPPGASRPQGPGFYVQISAVATQAAATAESARVKRAGYAPVIVKERGVLKIRTGGFRNRAEAEAALTQIKTRLGGHPFLVRVP